MHVVGGPRVLTEDLVVWDNRCVLHAGDRGTRRATGA
jgi:alpha-ketoglutarate-dependent taurine dioxygenase